MFAQLKIVAYRDSKYTITQVLGKRRGPVGGAQCELV